MFRNLPKNMGGGDSYQLPGSYNNNQSSRWNPFRSKQRDGSAASIHTAPTLEQAWKRASVATRATWITIVVGVLMIWFGWRWIRYSAAGIQINCNAMSCDIRVRPIGWGRRVHFTEVARQQLQLPYAVKTKRNGEFVTDKNIKLIEPYNKNNKKSSKSKNAYKGPDENGHYLTYAIILTDKGETPEHTDRNGESVEGVAETDLSQLHKYMEAITNEDGQKQHRLIPRQFGVRQSRRRVRTMIQKIESYVRRRRQKLVVRENAAPSWEGVLLIVFGVVAILITCIIGQFSEPVGYSGPGVRRQHSGSHRDTVKDSYRLATPSRYEVSTKSSASASGYRRNTTTARKRG